MADFLNDLYEDPKAVKNELPTQEQPTNPPANFLSDIYDDGSKQALSSSFNLGQNINDSKEVFDIADKTGYPIDLIQRNKDQIKKEMKDPDWDPEKIWSNYPIISEYMSQSPIHASAMKKDWKTMGYLERQWEFVKGKYSEGNDTIELSDIGQAAFRGDITQKQRERQRELQNQMSDRAANTYGIDSIWEQIPGHIANQVPIMSELTIQSMKGGAGGAAVGAGAALIAGQLGPQVALPEELATVPAAAIAGGFAGWRAKAFIEAFNLEGGLAFLDYEAIKDSDGKPLDRATAKGGAVIVGAVNGTLEAVSFQSVLKLAGADKLIAKTPGLRNLTRTGFKRLLQQKSTSQLMKNIATRVGQSALTEGGTEAMQEFSNIFVGELMPMIQDGSINTLPPEEVLNRIFSEENLSQIGQSFVAGASAGGGITVVGQTVTAPISYNDVSKAQTNKRFFEDLGQAIGSTDLKDNPTQVENLVEKMAGDKQTVYLPVEKFDEYWQKQGVMPEEIAREIIGDDGQAYNEAKASGEAIKVPTKKYASKLAATRHNDYFKDEVKFSPDELNAREMTEELANLEKIEAEAAKKTPEQTQNETELAEVQTTIETRLRDIGRTDQASRDAAQIIAQSMQAFSSRTGRSIKDLAARFAPNILAEESAQEGMGFDQRTLEGIESNKVKLEQEGFVFDISSDSYFDDAGNEIEGPKVGEPGSTFTIYAQDNTGNDIGQASFMITEDGKLMPNDQDGMTEAVTVDASFRRQGIATELYRRAAEITGLPIERAAEVTEFGSKFRKSLSEVDPDTFYQSQQLDMSEEARIQRAQDMGFDTSRELYHSTTADFQEFAVNPNGVNTYGEGVYFSDKKDTSYNSGESKVISSYVRDTKPIIIGDTVSDTDVLLSDVYESLGIEEVKLPSRKSLGPKNGAINNYRRLLHSFKKANGIRSDKEGKSKLREALIDAGYTSIHVSSAEGGFVNVFDPANIRSTDAAFDPSEADSANIYYQGARQIEQDPTQTEAFKNWFGDSKVVDESGNPLVVYHGTKGNFEVFEKSALGSTTGAASAEKGFFFTSSKPVATGYSVLSASDGSLKAKAELNKNKNALSDLQKQLKKKYKFKLKKMQYGETISDGDILSMSEADQANYFEQQSKYWILDSISNDESLSEIKRSFDMDKRAKQDLSIEKRRLEAAKKYLEDPTSVEWVYRFEFQDYDVKGFIEHHSPLIKIYEDKVNYSNKFKKFFNAELKKDVYKEFKTKPESGGKKTKQSKVYETYLSMKNPYTHNFDGNAYREETYNDIIKKAQKKGHDGVILRNTFDSAVNGAMDDMAKYEEMSDIFVVFEPNQIKSVENTGLFDPANDNIYFQQEGKAKGKIKFGDASIDITLFANADRSTFIHEMGHLYLEMIKSLKDTEGADAQLQTDFQTILNYLGVKSVDQIGVDQHEYFARSFEAYLREGKAPTVELRDAFSRFKSWLTRIYKTVRALDVELNDDIRAVFDRLVATDEQIAAAEQELSITDLFDGENLEGLGTVAEKYISDINRAKESAKEEQVKKHMAEIDRQEKKFYKEEFEKEYVKVLEELNQQKIYQLLDNMQRGQMPDGSPLLEGLPNFKISKASLLQYYDQAFLNTLPRPLVYTTKEGAMHVDTVAELAGYPSARDMIDEIIRTEKKEVVAEIIATENVFALHGKMMNKEQVHQAALESYHTDDRAKVLRNELKHLVSQSFATFKGLDKKVTRPIPPLDYFKSAARIMIRDKKVIELKPNQYKIAERQHSRKAHDLLLKGDIAGSFEAKKAQIFAHELYREAVKMQDKTNRAVDQINRFTTTKRRQMFGKAGTVYLDQIDSILEKYSFKSVSNKEVSRRQGMREFIAAQEEQGIPLQLSAATLQEVQKTHYKELTVGELIDVRDDIKQISHLAKLKNELLDKQEAVKFQDIKNEAMQTLQEFHKLDLNNISPEVVRAKYNHMPTSGQILKKNFKEWGSDLLKPEFILDAIGGFRENNVFHKYGYQPYQQASIKKAQYVDKIGVEFNKLSSLYTDKERASWLIKTERYPSIGNKEFSKMNVLTIALNWGNQYNREALMEAYGWSEDGVTQVLNTLDARDWQFVQGVWDLIDSLWVDVKALEERMTGLAPAKVKADSFETQYGTIKGGYYPIVFEAGLDIRQANIEEAQQVHNLFGGNFTKAMTQKGHTIERQGTGGRPLSLQLYKLQTHLDQVIHDLTHREAVINSQKFLNDPDIRAGIIETMGEEAWKQFNPWIKQLAGESAFVPTDKFFGFFSKVRKNATVVNMGVKFSTAIVQLSGLPVAADFVGVVPMLKQLPLFFNPKKINQKYKFVTDKSQFMKDRMKTFDRDVRDIMKSRGVRDKYGQAEYLRQTLKTEQISNSYFNMIGLMDMAVSLPTWLAAYDNAMAGNVENVIGDAEAVAYADKAVRMTQGSGELKDQSAVQRGSEPLKIFTMFYSYFSVLHNRFYHAYQRYKITKDVGKLLSSMALLWFVPLVIEDLILSRAPEDEDEKLKHYALRYATYPTMGVPMVRDLVNSFGEFSYAPTPAQAVGETASNLVKSLTDGELNRKDTKNAIMMSGYAFGLPSRQIWLSSEYLYDYLNGDVEPDNAGQGLYQGLVTGKPKD